MKLLRELTEAQNKEVVKTVLSYTDRDGNKYMLHVGDNPKLKNPFFIVLKTAHADHHLSTIMFNHKGGSAESAKFIRDKIKETWDLVKDKGPNRRGLALKTTLEDNSSVKNWKIEK
jgi:hypothetical protein